MRRRSPKRVRHLSATALASLVACGAADAATRSFTFSDGICTYRVRYDPRKIDGARLEATFDYLADAASTSELPPSGDVSAADAKEFAARCATHRRKLEAARLIELPGLEEVRRRDLREVETSCRRGEATLSAAKGDVEPMRVQAPACRRWADLLALPTPRLKSRWNDLVVELCTTSTERNVCAGQLQRDGEGPESEGRRRNAVLARWSECASTPDDGTSDRERQRLKAIMMKRFGAKTLSCAQ